MQQPLEQQQAAEEQYDGLVEGVVPSRKIQSNSFYGTCLPPFSGCKTHVFMYS